MGFGKNTKSKVSSSLEGGADHGAVSAPLSSSAQPNHTGVVTALVGMIGLMTALVVYSPELYNLFCKVTGYGGTTQRAVASSGVILDQKITVKFDATVAKGLNWKFKPVQRSMDVHIGETVVVNYIAKNLGKTPLVGSAIYNVTPEIAGSFFNKIECFCFTEQKLEAGEEIEMPVSFYVDPEIVTDKSGKTVNEITLSYVFFEKKKAQLKTASAVPAAE
ncbi:MAG: cytochrome c oxidase assembly protein [Rhodomicrobiaceae bacterium]